MQELQAKDRESEIRANFTGHILHELSRIANGEEKKKIESSSQCKTEKGRPVANARRQVTARFTSKRYFAECFLSRSRQP